MDWQERITVTPGLRSGKPCIKNTRITVYYVLEYLAGEMSENEILADFPDLTGPTSALASPLPRPASDASLALPREASLRRELESATLQAAL